VKNELKKRQTTKTENTKNKKRNYKEKQKEVYHKVAADGECLFNAVAFGVLFYQNNGKGVTKSDYKNLAQLFRTETVALLQKEYIKKMKTSCTWGGQLELLRGWVSKE
jgi:hypothetical protein